MWGGDGGGIWGDVEGALGGIWRWGGYEGGYVGGGGVTQEWGYGGDTGGAIGLGTLLGCCGVGDSRGRLTSSTSLSCSTFPFHS